MRMYASSGACVIGVKHRMQGAGEMNGEVCGKTGQWGMKESGWLWPGETRESDGRNLVSMGACLRSHI